MKIVKQEREKSLTLPTKELSIAKASILGSPIAMKIMQNLHKEPMYPKQLARKLKLHEQKVYYYIHKLEQAEIIKIIKQERLGGMIAKWYAPISDSFFVPIGEFQESSKVKEQESGFLHPFISNGILNSIIVVGSPDPHGPLKARSRDGYFGMDLALFLGTFLNRISESKVRLDTEIGERELQENHLIILGGPIVNKVAERLGKNAPIYFDEEKKGFFSTITEKLYVHEEVGVIVKYKSPFNKDKSILFLAGIRNSGTKAAILTFLQQFKEIEKGNRFDKNSSCKVVEGIDLDSDGIVDSVDILE